MNRKQNRLLRFVSWCVLLVFSVVTIVPTRLMAAAVVSDLDYEDVDAVYKKVHALSRRMTDPSSWDLERKSLALGDDPAAHLTFVREEIALEAYPGSMKGATGTLRTGAGNSLDQARLLGELLQKRGFKTRFLTAPLDAAGVRRASERLLRGVAQVPPSARPGSVASVDNLECDGCRMRGESFQDGWDSLVDLTYRDRDLIQAALSEAQVALGQPELTDRSRLAILLSQHSWVQYEDPGHPGRWIDLDPMATEGTPGAVLAPVTGSIQVDPAVEEQSLRLEVVAHLNRAGTEADAPETRILLEVDRPVSLLQGRGIRLVLAPVGREGRLDARAIRAADLVRPTLFISDERIDGDPIASRSASPEAPKSTRSAGSGGLLADVESVLESPTRDDSRPSEPQLNKIELVLTQRSPGSKDRVHRRELFSRGSSVSGSSVLNASDESVALGLCQELELWIDVGRDHGEWAAGQVLGALDWARSRLKPALENPTGIPDNSDVRLGGPSLTLIALSQLIWQAAVIGQSDSRASRVLRSTPGILVLRRHLEAAPDDQVRMVAAIDIVSSRFDVLDGTTGAYLLPGSLALGIMQTHLERFLSRFLVEALHGAAVRSLSSPSASSADSATGPGPTVGAVGSGDSATAPGSTVRAAGMADFVAATPGGMADFNVITSPLGLERIHLPAVGRARAVARLQEGFALLVPEHPLTVDGRERWGWWEIDRTTGDAIGVLDPGEGQSLVENLILRTKLAYYQVPFFLMSHSMRITWVLMTACLLGLLYNLGAERGWYSGSLMAGAGGSAACFFMDLMAPYSGGGRRGSAGSKTPRPPKPLKPPKVTPPKVTNTHKPGVPSPGKSGTKSPAPGMGGSGASGAQSSGTAGTAGGGGRPGVAASAPGAAAHSTPSMSGGASGGKTSRIFTGSMRLGGGFKKTPPAAVSVGPSSQAPGVKAAGTDAGTKPLGSLSKPPKPTRPAPPKSTPPASPTNQTPAQIGKKLENLGIRKPDLQGLDGSDLKALDQATSMWGTGKDGRHQGIRHIQDYALGKDGPEKMGRLTRLKDILGGGPYSAQDPRSITKVTQTLQSNLPAQGSPYHRVSSNEEGVKNIFFLRSPGATGDPTNSTKGIVVIEFDGKLQSFFNTEFGKFKKLK